VVPPNKSAAPPWRLGDGAAPGHDAFSHSPLKPIQPYLHRSPGGTLRPVPLSGPPHPLENRAKCTESGRRGGHGMHNR
jgi:hypothetical protein